jgi:hypothetical protein
MTISSATHSDHLKAFVPGSECFEQFPREKIRDLGPLPDTVRDVRGFRENLE